MSVYSTPWRLACPEGHRTVRRVTTTETTGMLAGRAQPTPSRSWRCETCRETYPTVRDLKSGSEVSP